MTQQSITNYTTGTDDVNEDINSTVEETETDEQEHDNKNDSKKITASDGGIPFKRIFKETGVRRVNELEMIEDEDNLLYAFQEANKPESVTTYEINTYPLAQKIAPEPGTVVRVDAETGSVESIESSVLADVELTPIDNDDVEHGD